MIARAMMHTPQVLFLDEPSTGLDPAARLFVWDRIRDLREQGVTIVITTHDMDEAATLAERVGIMDRGHLLALDTPAALTRSLPGKTTLEIAMAGADGSLEPALQTLEDAGRRRAARAARTERRPRPPLRHGRGADDGRARRDGPADLRHYAVRREDRRAEPRGRVHRAHRTGAAVSAPVASPHRVTAPAVFLSVLWRDLFVTGRELPVFLAQVVLQPLFMLFIFGKVLAEPGLHPPGIHAAAVPGHRRADGDAHGAAIDGAAPGDRVQLHEGDRGPAAGADPGRARSPSRRWCSRRCAR